MERIVVESVQQEGVNDMKAIKAYTQIYGDINGQDILRKIEACGRVCYKSEDKITDDSAAKFVAGIVKRGHEAVLEFHESLLLYLSHRFSGMGIVTMTISFTDIPSS